jgi:hypothetical protein
LGRAAQSPKSSDGDDLDDELTQTEQAARNDWGQMFHHLTQLGWSYAEVASLSFPQAANALHEGKEPPPRQLKGKRLKRFLDDFKQGKW